MHPTFCSAMLCGGATRHQSPLPHQDNDAPLRVHRHRVPGTLASTECHQRGERQEEDAQATMPSSTMRKEDLRDLTDAQQVTLVQDVLRGDEEAILTFLRCTERLLTQIAHVIWGAQDVVWYADERLSKYYRLDRVLYPFTYLVYGLRPTGYAESSPLQRWLDHPDQRIPLANV